MGFPWLLISESGVFCMAFPSSLTRKKGLTGFLRQKNLLLRSRDWARFCHWQSRERKRYTRPRRDLNSLEFPVDRFFASLRTFRLGYSGFTGLRPTLPSSFWGVSLPGQIDHRCYPVPRAVPRVVGLVWWVTSFGIHWMVLTDGPLCNW